MWWFLDLKRPNIHTQTQVCHVLPVTVAYGYDESQLREENTHRQTDLICGVMSILTKQEKLNISLNILGTGFCS